ncbi:MAG: hypothetical protein J7L20_03945 [Thermoplasmata archaeon]|nr:hypothetical protein [Thermoplasmata archaeon]
MKTKVLIIAVILSILLIGVAIFQLKHKTKLYEIRIGWWGSDGIDFTRYHFEYFDGSGSKVIKVDKPSKLVLRYNISLHSGEIELKVVSPEGYTIWNKSFVGSEKDLKEIMLSESGWYKIIIFGNSAEEGYFDVSWNIHPT